MATNHEVGSSSLPGQVSYIDHEKRLSRSEPFFYWGRPNSAQGPYRAPLGETCGKLWMESLFGSKLGSVFSEFGTTHGGLYITQNVMELIWD